MFKTFTFNQEEILAAPASVVFGTPYTYYLNSLFQPYPASGTRQPYGFDQLCAASALYQRYKVNAVRIRLVFSNAASDCQIGASLIGQANVFSLSGADPQLAREQPFTVVRTLSNTGTQRTEISTLVHISDLYGVTKEEFRSDINTSTGPYNGNPTTLVKLEVAIQDPRGVGTTAACSVSLDYLSMLYCRTSLPPS